MTDLKQFPLLTAEQIANSPSRRDGVSAAAEAKNLKWAAKIIYQTSEYAVPKMSAVSAAMAVTFFVRYFALHSLKCNSPFIVAAACLFLAGKANNEPHNLQALTVEMFKRWYGRENPDMRKKLYDHAYFENMIDAVCDAEFFIMYAVGFDFDTDLLHANVLRIKDTVPCLSHVKGVLKFQQFVLSACNDIMRRDAALVLQYPPTQLALTVCDFYFKQKKEGSGGGGERPSPAPDGQPWYTTYGLPVQQYKAISDRLLTNVYIVTGEVSKASTIATTTAVTESAVVSNAVQAPTTSAVEGGAGSSMAGGSAGEGTAAAEQSMVLLSTAEKPASPEGGAASFNSNAKRKQRELSEEAETRPLHEYKRYRPAAPAPAASTGKWPSAAAHGMPAAAGGGGAARLQPGHQFMHPQQQRQQWQQQQQPYVKTQVKQDLKTTEKVEEESPVEEGEIEEGEIVE